MPSSSVFQPPVPGRTETPLISTGNRPGEFWLVRLSGRKSRSPTGRTDVSLNSSVVSGHPLPSPAITRRHPSAPPPNCFARYSGRYFTALRLRAYQSGESCATAKVTVPPLGLPAPLVVLATI